MTAQMAGEKGRGVDPASSAAAGPKRGRTRILNQVVVNESDPSTAWIILTDVYGVEKARTLVNVNRIDDLLAVGRWSLHSAGYAAANVHEGTSHKVVYLHRVVAQARIEEAGSRRVVIDHVNHDKLDNREENLRVLTHAQNIQNRSGANSNSSSGTRCVSWNKSKAAWVVRCTTNRCGIEFGEFGLDVRGDAEAVAIQARRCLFPYDTFTHDEDDHEGDTFTKWEAALYAAQRIRLYADRFPSRNVATSRADAIFAIHEVQQEGGSFRRDVAGEWRLRAPQAVLRQETLERARRQKCAILRVLDEVYGVW